MSTMLTATQLSQKIHHYLPDADTSIVERAYAFAKKAHQGQIRLSGDPYFSHCVATARHLIDMQLDPTTIAAGLLHDVSEDTDVTLDEIRDEYGPEVAFLVDGVTKLSKVRLDQRVVDERDKPTDDEEAKRDREAAAAENLRKMFLAMAQDIRVVLIKLADRQHNMETLASVPEAKQRRIALETMEIYAPLAERLGMGEIKGLLQDLAFPYIDPKGYDWITSAAQQPYRDATRYLRRVMHQVEEDLAAHHIDASVHGRAKHLFSLYKKIEAKGRDFGEVYDLVAVRILVDDVPTCYEVRGLIHQQWKPLLGRIKDYISLPKPSGYQSLHTTVFCLDGRVVEFQIRTQQMHLEAEYGIAAHWRYSSYKGEAVQNQRQLAWVRQLAKWQAEVSSSKEFLEALKIDTFEHRIFIFTPKGEVKDLPAGATPLDFAYQIHSKIGDHTYGAKINGKLSHLSTELRNGDVVEILTSGKSKPRPDWLDLAKTTSAKAHIRKSLREQQAAEQEQETEKVVVVDTEVVEQQPSKPKVIKVRGPEVLVEGRRGYHVQLAKCCQPQLGDSIIGLISEKGITVHQRWCKNVRSIGDPTKLVRVSWLGEAEKQRVQLRMEAYDRRGLARDLAAMVTDAGWNIVGVRGDSMEDGVVSYSLLLEIEAGNDLQALIKQLQQHPNVYLIERQ